MTHKLRVFVSSVTDGLGYARLEVARVLRTKGIDVTDQAHFHQGGATLLNMLSDEIEGSDAVILLIGNRQGEPATPEHLAVLNEYPQVQRMLAGMGAQSASYTQLEFAMAKHFGRITYVFFAGENFPRQRVENGPPPAAELPVRVAAQASYQTWVKSTGEHYDVVDSMAKLIERVLVLPFRNLGISKPRSARFSSIGTLFKGREQDIAELDAALGQGAAGLNGPVAITAKPASLPASLHGLGGVGKTQLAIEYGTMHERDFSALLFISGETPQQLDSELANLTGVLGLEGFKGKPDAERKAASLNWLKQNPGWYLVIDNADSDEAALAVRNELAAFANGALVITSRLANWGAGFTSLALDVLSPEAAVAFLLERTGAERQTEAHDAAEAKALASELDHLALALEQAGAYIAANFISFAAYRVKWKKRLGEFEAWHAAQPKAKTDYPRSVDVTWLVSFEKLSKQGQRLLERLAWLAPEPIPLSLLDVSFKIPVELADQLMVVDARPALAELLKYSLARRVQGEGQIAGFAIHRLVQDVSRRQQKDEPPALFEALLWLNKAFDGDPQDVRSWQVLDPLAPHVTALAGFADEKGIPQPTASLLNNLGSLALIKANHSVADPFYLRALAICESNHGHEHPSVAACLNNLASLLGATNRLAEAEPLYRRALAINEASYGPDHPSVAIHLNNLASLLGATNRLAEAEPLYRRALAINEVSYGPDHPSDAACLNNLAELLRATNRLAEAEPLYRRALAINEASYGPDHPEVATCLNNLAGLLYATNRLAEAEQLYRRALAIDEASYGPDHPSVAIRLNNLAGLLYATNRLAEAEPLSRRHLLIFMRFTKSTGHEHPHLHGAMRNYAGILQELGRSEDDINFEINALAAEAGLEKL